MMNEKASIMNILDQNKSKNSRKIKDLKEQIKEIGKMKKILGLEK